jgi:hypothetical protein
MATVSDSSMSIHRRRFAAAIAVAFALLASGCGGDDDSNADAASTPTSTAPTVPEGITPPGQTLELGTPATLVYQANPKATSRIKVTVTQVRKGKTRDLAQFNLDAKTKKSSVYYVDTFVRNVGSGNLSGQALTLFGKVSDDLVVRPAVFGSPFPRCNYHAFPKGFTQDKATKICLVMFAPNGGKVSQVQWRDADSEPIAWATR